MAELKVWDTDPTIYLFTSLTAGSSHIITATSRIETILKANKIPFKGVDTATDDLARKLFQRRASGKKLPLIVKEGYVLGGIEEIEEWNEYDELREALGVTTSFTPLPAKPAAAAPVPSPTTATAKKENIVQPSPQQNLAIRQLGAEAAKAAAAKKQTPAPISTTNPLLASKTNTPTSATPAKSPAKPDPTILSPRSIPLPQTPGSATTAKPNEQSKAAIPNLANLQKPVHAPPSMHTDAADPALDAGPISETKADDKATEESSEEEDSEEDEDDSDEEEDEEEDDDHDDDEEEEEEEEEEQEEEEEESSEEEDSEDERVRTKDAKAATQAQDPKDGTKAGVSVQEGEEASSSEEDEEEETPTTAQTTLPAAELPPSKVAPKHKSSAPKKTAPANKKSLAEKLAAANQKKLVAKKKLADEKKVADKKRRAAKDEKRKKTSSSAKGKTGADGSGMQHQDETAQDKKKEADSSKPLARDAGDASKAGQSVAD